MFAIGTDGFPLGLDQAGRRNCDPGTARSLRIAGNEAAASDRQQGHGAHSFCGLIVSRESLVIYIRRISRLADPELSDESDDVKIDMK